MRTTVARTAGVLLLVAGVAVPQDAAGRITGRVADAAGQPVAGAIVTLARAGDPPSAATAGAAVRRVVTGADGTYASEGLAAGAYQICVAPPAGARLLDSCAWTTTRRTLALGAGVAGRVDVPLAAGTRLEVRVADAGARLLGAGAEVRRVVGVLRTDGSLAPARLLLDVDGPHHVVVVPVGVPLRLFVAQAGGALADERGARLGADALVPVQAAAGQATLTVRLQAVAAATVVP